ncbi:unnamed protein product [Acanthosepion pharaonis]|uniref:DDE-1 domain-containing protein n=1 Tax=Acanthosepion pharaonis TaxID=158019 RepID=A0A812DWY4_ACAPH|nr:unnamed protein product [Sepia pharaonis]
MNEDLFVDYMLRFIQHTGCTKERPVLLILDNVEEHITIKTIDLARENGVLLLTLPSHTSHRLQPLDKAVYGPFKKAYNAAMDGWIRSHPGRTVTIYDIPTIVSEAHLCAMSQRNIKAGFAATGIYPYNSWMLILLQLQLLTVKILKQMQMLQIWIQFLVQAQVLWVHCRSQDLVLVAWVNSLFPVLVNTSRHQQSILSQELNQEKQKGEERKEQPKY